MPATGTRILRRCRAFGLVLLLVVAACDSPQAAMSPASSTTALGHTLPDYWYGVTVDDVSHIDAVSASIAALPRMPVTRLVFDTGEAPADYADAVRALRPISYLLGTPVDSTEVANYSVSQYVDRFRDYVQAFGPQVDVWEVGNEVNGEWLGQTSDVVAKIVGATQVVRSAGGRTALTLYDNTGCSPDPGHDMLTWARTNLPDSLRTELDYVLVSYYEHDCANRRPSTGEWSALFAQLHTLFPQAKLGFGETGTDKNDSVAAKQSYLTHYYTLPRFGAYYLGGYFWWYYAEDMVPYQGNPLWQQFAALARP